MRKILLLLILLSASNAYAVDLGLVSANDTINIPVFCMDTLGRKAQPDSSQVITWYHGEGANDYSYSASNSAGGASGSWLDSVQLFGFTNYHFIDQISDLDSNYTSGLFSGSVLLWAEGFPTYNPFSFSKIDESADDIIPRLDTTISSRSEFDQSSESVTISSGSVDNIWDEPQSGHTSSGTFGKFLDTELTGRSSFDQLSDRVLISVTEKSDIADRVWDELVAGHNTDATFGDSLITLSKMVEALNNFNPSNDSVMARSLVTSMTTPIKDSLLHLIFDFDMDDSTLVFLEDKFYHYIRYAKTGIDSLILVTRPPEIWTVIDSGIVGGLIADYSAGASVPDSLFNKIDSLMFSLGYSPTASVQGKLGALGTLDYLSTDSTLNVKMRQIRGVIDSIITSIGYDSVNLHGKIDGLNLSGSGTEPETLLVMSYNDSTLIQGARIQIKTIDQSTIKVPGLATDVNGIRILELDPDSFYVSVTHNNYLMIQDTIIVSTGGATDTLWMSLFDPGYPADPNLCRVYGWVYDITGEPLENVKVTVEIPTDYHPVKYTGAVITPFRQSINADSTGYWEIDIFPNSVLSEPDSKYLFIVENSAGIALKTKVAVPDSATWQLR